MVVTEGEDLADTFEATNTRSFAGACAMASGSSNLSLGKADSVMYGEAGSGASLESRSGPMNSLFEAEWSLRVGRSCPGLLPRSWARSRLAGQERKPNEQRRPRSHETHAETAQTDLHVEPAKRFSVRPNAHRASRRVLTETRRSRRRGARSLHSFELTLNRLDRIGQDHPSPGRIVVSLAVEQEMSLRSHPPSGSV